MIIGLIGDLEGDRLRLPGALRCAGGFLADCSPRSGRGRRADGARERAVLARDVSGRDVGRGARRPRLAGRKGAVLDDRVDRRALSREPRGRRRAGRRAGRDRHVGPALGRRGGVGEAAVCALRVCGRPRHGCGAALLQAVVDPGESVVLWVADPNPRAQAFYRKHGFVADGTAQVEGGVREIRMVRNMSGRDAANLLSACEAPRPGPHWPGRQRSPDR